MYVEDYNRSICTHSNINDEMLVVMKWVRKIIISLVNNIESLGRWLMVRPRKAKVINLRF